MSSHKLNLTSSRSHCMFTLYVEASPLASPQELVHSRLSLVDLAGSERAEQTGATTGVCVCMGGVCGWEKATYLACLTKKQAWFGRQEAGGCH